MFYSVIMSVLDRMRNGLNRAVAAVIESQRDNFATGWPELGVGPIDPFYLEEYRLDQLEGFASIDMNLTDTYIKGLQKFRIVSVNIRPALLSAVFVIAFDKIDFEGYHNTSAAILGTGIGSGQGPYTMSLNNLVLTVTVQFDWINFEFIKLHRLNVNYVIGLSDVNFQGFNFGFGAIFNVLARVAIPGYITAKQVELNQRIQDEIIPLVNDYILDDVSFVNIFEFLIRFLKNFAIRSVIDYVQDLVCHL